MSFAQNAGGVGKVKAAHSRKRKTDTTRTLKLKGGRTGKAKGKPKAKGTGKVREHELYSTPPEATQALLDRYGVTLRGRKVWECAVGEWQLANVLTAGGCTVVGTDLNDLGREGQGGVMFQTAPWPEGMGEDDAVVTNPPFSQAAAFILHAVVDLKASFVALLLKASYFHAAERLELFERCPPTAVHPLGWRLDFTGEGSPAMEMSWYVWTLGGPAFGRTLYEPMQRPRPACDDLFSGVAS